MNAKETGGCSKTSEISRSNSDAPWTAMLQWCPWCRAWLQRTWLLSHFLHCMWDTRGFCWVCIAFSTWLGLYFFFYCIVNADGPNLGWHVVRYIVKAVVRGSVVMNVECSLACASFRSALSRTGSERLSWKLSWMPLRGYASSLLQPCLSLMVLTYQQWECLFQFMQYCLHLSSGAHWPLTYCWHFN